MTKFFKAIAGESIYFNSFHSHDVAFYMYYVHLQMFLCWFFFLCTLKQVLWLSLCTSPIFLHKDAWLRSYLCLTFMKTTTPVGHHLIKNLFSPWYIDSWKIALALNNNHSLLCATSVKSPKHLLYLCQILKQYFIFVGHSVCWNNSPRVAPLGHIIPIPSQPVFALTSECCMLNGEATNTKSPKHLLYLCQNLKQYFIFVGLSVCSHKKDARNF
jgi:hypothetical protein